MYSTQVQQNGSAPNVPSLMNKKDKLANRPRQNLHRTKLLISTDGKGKASATLFREDGYFFFCSLHRSISTWKWISYLQRCWFNYNFLWSTVLISHYKMLLSTQLSLTRVLNQLDTYILRSCKYQKGSISDGSSSKFIQLYLLQYYT